MATRFEKLVNEAKKNASEISPRKAAEAAEKGGALIIDVRDPDESQAAYVPNAKTISRGTLEIEIEELAPDTSTPIICYFVAVGVALRLRPKVCKEWVTPM